MSFLVIQTACSKWDFNTLRYLAQELLLLKLIIVGEILKLQYTMGCRPFWYFFQFFFMIMFHFPWLVCLFSFHNYLSRCDQVNCNFGMSIGYTLKWFSIINIYYINWLIDHVHSNIHDNVKIHKHTNQWLLIFFSNCLIAFQCTFLHSLFCCNQMTWYADCKLINYLIINSIRNVIVVKFE